ncbi:chemotaxis response regulator protein-glutamate methylesterase, partial [Treponema pallidum]
AAQLARLYTEGSRTIAQDADSCIVYGMPRVACELGAVGEQVSLDDMAATINRYGKVFASS